MGAGHRRQNRPAREHRHILSALRGAALETVAPDAAWTQADATLHLLGDYLADTRALELAPTLTEAIYRYGLFTDTDDLVDDLRGAAEREDQRIGDGNLYRR
ncbi:hypothetical protein [Rugosimonospora acidiphila]|uniref:hypothetical protein n=1 Tax=Rugosimonospora acidiphila TaxID=556531 RepID=UPI0031F0EAEB